MRAADRNTFGTSIFEGSRGSAGAGGFCGVGSLLGHAAAETATAVNASCTASAWSTESTFAAAFATVLPITTAAGAAAAAEVQVKMEIDAPNSSTSCSDVKMFELDGNGEVLLFTAGSGCCSFEMSDVQLVHDTDAYFA
jgi:hypothetical protein